MTTSPAAQAVEAAILKVASVPGFERRRIIAAAALRAAVVQTQHPGSKHYRGFDNWQCDAGALLAIATELEGAND